MRCNRREQLNQYWREQRQTIREAKERKVNKSVDPQVFLKNKALLYQVVSWIVSQGGEAFARKELDRTGVPIDGIEQIIQAAHKEISK